jgi:hypothetical protein
VTVNHFGNPALGQVNIETWLLVTYNQAFRPAALTAQASAEKLAVARPAKRVAFRVELRSNAGPVGSSPTVNTGDTAAQRTVSGPTVTGLDADPPTGCFFSRSSTTRSAGRTTASPAGCSCGSQRVPERQLLL